MNGGIFLQLALDSLAAAGIYAIVGMAVFVAHSGSRVLHLAIGEVAMAGALVAANLAGRLPLALAVIVGLAVAAAVSVAGERVLVAPLVRRVELAAVLLVAGAVVLRELVRGLYSRAAYSFPAVGGTARIGSGSIRAADLVTIAAAALVAGGGAFVLRRTLAGAALRATAAAPDSAELIGVDTARVRTAAFAVAGVLAAGAALLAADRLPLSATAGIPLALKGLAAAVAGRLLSPLTVCAGALVIGATEVVGTYFLGGGGEVLVDGVAVAMLATAWWRR